MYLHIHDTKTTAKILLTLKYHPHNTPSLHTCQPMYKKTKFNFYTYNHQSPTLKNNFKPIPGITKLIKNCTFINII